MPQSSWSNKEERQYEHIKQSAQKRGKGKRAKEIAARTVNKQRRQKGKTANRTTQGTGNPNSQLKDHSREELYNRAKQLDISGRSNMNKAELIRAIQRAA